MEVAAVSSSNIRQLAWEGSRLWVQFLNTGKTYTYDGVPYELFVSLQRAESVGSFFYKEIRQKFQGEPGEFPVPDTQPEQNQTVE